jgi:DICT domain-containing protein
MMAQQAGKTLTVRGEDRVESIVRHLQSVVVQERQRQQVFPSSRSRYVDYNEEVAGDGVASEQDSWDMAFLSADEASQQLSRKSGQLRIAPEQMRMFNGIDTFSPGVQEQVGAIAEVQQILKQEVFLRYIIRMWRVFHIALAVVTVGLTLWHIEYALSLVIPALQKFGFGYLLPWP